MSEPDFDTFPLWRRGNQFEDFEVGQVFEHQWERYTTHYPVERYCRDARLTKIFEGTSEIMQRIVSDRIMGK
jgi:alkylation response protein AidB-like acyl-CoA dehydrogenase|tara:strand:+ start:499 stop:714 length:216 start_codon:yes stop_codon:yes gene_type:complete